MRTRAVWAAVVVAALSAMALVGVSAAAANDATEYQVTITNLTDGQPLTPPAVATHRRPLDVFDVGAPASFGVKEIAENGNLAPLLDAFEASPFVSASLEAPGGPLVPDGLPGSAMFDDSTSFTITAAHGANYLSFVSMLICTNDGFTGLSGLRLPRHVGDSVTVLTNSYDAGTEVNTEDFADIVPPCQGLVGVSSGEPGTGTKQPGARRGRRDPHAPGHRRHRRPDPCRPRLDGPGGTAHRRGDRLATYVGWRHPAAGPPILRSCARPSANSAAPISRDVASNMERCP